MSKKLLSLILTIIILSSCVYVKADDNVSTSEPSNLSTNITYNNYYYNLNPNLKYYKLRSLNNSDKDAYWRPKYSDIQTPLQEYVEINNKNTEIETNGFDVDWSDINKSTIPTSRALQMLGYDFLLSKEIINPDTKKIVRTVGYNTPITSYYFIMNIYKSLGLPLYDISYEVSDSTSSIGVLVTRSNPESYWKKFINDHPIDYDVYDNYNPSSTSMGSSLKTSDAIIILSQMLDFYGEQKISSKEEYMLLQVYGSDVPADLDDKYKKAWSYLKCRGIIGEQELSYDSPLSFTDMMNLLMSASDTNSRTNFKEVSIQVSLEDALISNGFYEDKVSLTTTPYIAPVSASIDFSAATRYDYLIEFNESTKFNTNDSLFISAGPLTSSQPIPGSVYEGVYNGKYYHFTIPISEAAKLSKLYVNTKEQKDLPKLYQLPSSKGGVYQSPKDDGEDGLIFTSLSSFDKSVPDSLLVDESRKKTKTKSLLASDATTSLTVTFKSDNIDIPLSTAAITKAGGTVTTVIEGGKSYIRVDFPTSELPGIMSYNNAYKHVGKLLVFIQENSMTSQDTSAILSLTGDKLLVNVDDMVSLKLIKGYKIVQDSSSDIILLYANNGNIIVVDNKTKVIQKGSEYLAINTSQPLISNSGGKTFVDFRAIYGLKDIAFDISLDSSTGNKVVKFYDNVVNRDTHYSASYVSGYTYQKETTSLGYYSPLFLGGNETKVDLLLKGDLTTAAGQVLLPLSSYNPLGNYILYGSYDQDYNKEEYYIVIFSPKGVKTKVSSDANVEDLFRYMPKADLSKYYDISISKINSSDMFVNVPGVGWCFNIQKMTDSVESRKSYLSSYKSNPARLPYNCYYNSLQDSITFYSYNMNLLSIANMNDLVSPSSNDFSSSAIPAAIGVQAWFSNPSVVTSLGLDTVKSGDVNLKGVNAPSLWWGTIPVQQNSSNSLVTTVGNFSLDSYYKDNDARLQGVNGFSGNYAGDLMYMSTGIYSIVSSDYSSALNKNIEESKLNLNKVEVDLQEFFSQFENITMQEIINGFDNYLSLAYFLLTRVVPLIISTMLILIIIITSMSDMRLLQLFCERVVDPIKILTFGKHNIQTVDRKFIILSHIGALIIMGVIQGGAIEKLVMFVVRAWYALTLLIT